MDSSDTALLLDLGMIIVLARVLATIAGRLGQPAVVGEIVAGILVGPTLFHGAIVNTLFPGNVRPLLGAVANMGVAMFMFTTGLETDRGMLRGRTGTVIAVSFGAMLVPLLTGVLAGLAVQDHHATRSHLVSVLFLGLALSVTAFPVLARILSDRKLDRTPLGTLALACAAVDDVLVWVLLAVVLSLVDGAATWTRTVMLLPYLAVCFFVVRPLLRRFLGGGAHDGRVRANLLGVLVAGLLLSGGLTAWMGLNFIFGAFLFGVVVPPEALSWLRGQVVDRVQQLNGVFFLPVFFVVAGLNVNLANLTLTDVGELALILVTSVAGKFLGTYLLARARRLGNRESAALAVLMNTRGLTELIILNVGLQFGLLDGRLYSMMVVMAMVTTAMTGPMLNLVYPSDRMLDVPEFSSHGARSE